MKRRGTEEEKEGGKGEEKKQMEEKEKEEERNTKDARIGQLEEELSRMKEEKTQLNKPSRVITSIESLTIHHSHPQYIDQQGNVFTRNSSGDTWSPLSCPSTIIGEPLSSVCVVMFIYISYICSVIYDREYFLCIFSFLSFLSDYSSLSSFS